jgi:hypothetical protein
MKTPWFGPKLLFGAGISPHSWEGWLCTAVYIALIVLCIRYPFESDIYRKIAIGMSTLIFGVIIYLRYES